MTYRVGVDIGGSFADFVVLDTRSHELVPLKVMSRPDAPGQDVLEGLQILRDQHDIDLSQVVYFTHGTTVGVNAVVQGRGIRLGMITNRFFEDVLELGRLKTPDMYSLFSNRPAPIIERQCVRGVQGRLDPEGREDVALDLEEVREAARYLVEQQACEGILISFLHAYRCADHEHAAQQAIQAVYPDLFVQCASDVWPIIREYERTVTASLAAYTQPVINRYLTHLQQVLADERIPASLRVTKSNGGVTEAETARHDGIQVILSGTASGVMGAAYVAGCSGHASCLSLDMGGTTADVALIENATPQFSTGEYVGDHQMFIPSVSVNSIGDGGGSIAWVDSLGVLRVGPESAGSRPGPVCFGQGGTRPTLTDAYAVLGYIGHQPLSYGAVRLNTEGARQAMAELAAKIDKTIEETAAAIIDVAISGMYAGVSRLTSRYGVDLADYTLLPFGGAGPMVACHFARAVRMKNILIPAAPGVLSALGGLIADTRNDFVKTTFYDLSQACSARMKADFESLRDTARAWMTAESGASDHHSIEIVAEMRYQGQSFEVATPLSEADIENQDVERMRQSFHQVYQRLYGYCDLNATIQIISLRVVVTRPNPKPSIPLVETATQPPRPDYHTRLYVDHGEHDTPVFHRTNLRGGHVINGPAMVTQSDTTITILPGFRAQVDPQGNLLIDYLDGREEGQP